MVFTKHPVLRLPIFRRRETASSPCRLLGLVPGGAGPRKSQYLDHPWSLLALPTKFVSAAGPLESIQAPDRPDRARFDNPASLYRGQFCPCTTTAHAFFEVSSTRLLRVTWSTGAVYLVVRLPRRPHPKYLVSLPIHGHGRSFETPLRKAKTSHSNDWSQAPSYESSQHSPCPLAAADDDDAPVRIQQADPSTTDRNFCPF